MDLIKAPIHPSSTVATLVDVGKVVNYDLLKLDTDGIRGISVHLQGTWAGTVVFQGANNPAFTNYITLRATSASNGALTTSATTNGLWLLPATCRFVRGPDKCIHLRDRTGEHYSLVCTNERP